MPARKLRPVEDSPTDHMSPIEEAALRQEAMSSIDHPLHALFCMEQLVGNALQAGTMVEHPETCDLELVKRHALAVAGLAQKVAFWCDRQFWIKSHPD